MCVAYVMTIPLQAKECRIQSTFERDGRPNVLHTRASARALDLGNVTSPASMTDVTSLGDFLEKHTHTRKITMCVYRHLHPWRGKKKITKTYP
jgi:hypothetical protein